MLYVTLPKSGICGDICMPLIELWNLIKTEPDAVVQSYTKHWQALQKQGYEYFYTVREKFNKNKNGLDLLFLSRTCVNGLIRFNAKGDFNNSLHHSRPGIAPNRLAHIVALWSHAIRNTTFTCGDYRETTHRATASDFIYLDPPYFNTKGRYYGTIDYTAFIQYLEDLNQRGVRFALSYDGIRGDENYTKELPRELYKRHMFLPSGNSSFKKVMGKEAVQVYESLYLNY